MPTCSTCRPKRWPNPRHPGEPGSISLVLATANPDKSAEITAILATVPNLVLLPRPSSVPDVEETGDTLVDNARLKARALSEATGLPAVSDDTGLEVDALGGAPGVYSARFAGEHASYADNVAKLLAELARVGANDPERTPGGVPVRGHGRLPGRTRGVGGRGRCTAPSPPRPWGVTPGSVTTPIFAPDGFDGRTFAQMSAEEKHSISHRGRAFRALAERLGAPAESS